MNRHPFYEIPPGTYLFPEAVRSAYAQKQLEEPVRQWCAFELMRAYGISIEQLVFEYKIRVGSKFYRADIAILQNGRPWAVVECKEPGHAKHDDAIDQAVSYANAEVVRATFAVYTNGRVWHVRRRIGDQWMPVPDLPSPLPAGAALLLVQLLRTQNAVAPLLHKLGEPLEREDARRLLCAMQQFFNGMTLLTLGSSKDLLAATDNLLRVLSGVHLHANYRLGKVAAAASHFEAFRKQAGYSGEIPPPTGTADIQEELQYLHVAVLDMVEGIGSLGVPDGLLLRLAAALLEYGRSQRDPRPAYPRIGNNVHDALRAYLSCGMAINLNASLPDPLDFISCQDLKDYCEAAWSQIETD